ncbi:helix-turn-helix XRE-family transcriptional regulators [Candidatus Termititenax aidoneus]|uniref:Helix-turn-helix XRE-family transcriptional regulators n=1 Tax=Termititenax aidoneus TaxID=2218524 RepID=A0A388TE87_TERA1|nr:helix-turn-helix XRE-family transcriptional regulators [Candidatus Termititenax aidoneus]
MPDFQQIKNHLGKRLKNLRLERDLTIEVLTGLIDMDFSNYVHLESAKKSNPTLETLCKLAEFYDVPVNYFFQDFKLTKELSSQRRSIEKKLLTVFRNLKSDSQRYCLQFLSGIRSK